MSTHSTVQTVRPEPGSIWPSSHLTAEQEIRATAIRAVAHMSSTPMGAVALAELLVPYIRDGVKPERTPRPLPPPAPPAPGITRKGD